ncbi:hypothetical protein L0222_05745 [bacterium]|nr:hypothetical protein [bacterium]
MILSYDIFNRCSETVIAVPITILRTSQQFHRLNTWGDVEETTELNSIPLAFRVFRVEIYLPTILIEENQ